MAEEIINAQIEDTMLGNEDHGILTFYLFLKFDGSGQGFGGYALSTYDKEKKRRVGHAFGTDCILQILDVLKARKWEELRGKYVRVKRDAGWSGKIRAIGHIVEDKWFNIEDLAKEHFPND
jgi:hypothetical protein